MTWTARLRSAAVAACSIYPSRVNVPFSWTGRGCAGILYGDGDEDEDDDAKTESRVAEYGVEVECKVQGSRAGSKDGRRTGGASFITYGNKRAV